MLELIMTAALGLSDFSLMQWQTGQHLGYYCDVSVGAKSKYLELGANSELWSVTGGGYGIPVYANYGVYGQLGSGMFTLKIQHNCLHYVNTNTYDNKLQDTECFYQHDETRLSVGIKLKQKVW